MKLMKERLFKTVWTDRSVGRCWFSTKNSEKFVKLILKSIIKGVRGIKNRGE